LDSAPISDTGLRNLAEVDSLVLVSLQNTAVTEAGLEQLGSMTRLKTVLLDGKQIRWPRLAPSEAPEQ
jgi:hypothetical protein